MHKRLSSTRQSVNVWAAWQEQVSTASRSPWLLSQLVQRGHDIWPCFTAYSSQLRVLFRLVRKALECKLARSLAGVALLLTLAQGQGLADTINVTGPCTLVDAITAANTDAATGGCTAGSGADTIVLTAGSTHTLTVVNNSGFGPNGLPVVSSAITISGNGSTVQRDGAAVFFRLLQVASAGNLTVQDLTLRGGVAAFNAPLNLGGGVLNFGTLTLTNSTVSGNSAITAGGKGGGVFSAFNSGPLTLTNSTISGNAASGDGGGVFNVQTTTLTNSTISGNTAANSGGGVFNNGGPLTVTDSIISGNTAGGGGGVLNAGPMTLTNSTVSSNTADFGSGGGVNNLGTLTLTNSTLSGNMADFGGGGGVFNSGGLTLTNSTLSDNSADGGGGVWNQGSGTVTLNRTLVSGNTASTGPEIANSATITADDFNLFGHSGAAGVSGFAPGVTDIVPGAGVMLSNILSPLANNGGPTFTHALVTGSPAINASPADANCPATDQRGVTRPQGPACDISAFEESTATDVALNWFTADAYSATPNSPNGGALLRWQTGYEVANLGFNIYRDEAGKRVRVTPDMIAGSAFFVGARTVLGAGGSYVWRDPQGANADADYWLESVDINGSSAWYGPVRSSGVKKSSAAFEPNSKVMRDLGEDQTAPDASTPVETKPKQARMSAARLAVQAVAANQPGVKIAVRREGWYRIAQSELVAAGLDARVDPLVLQLMVDGQELPINVLIGKDGRVSAIEFYGIGADSPYTSLRTYWLTAGEQPGKRIDQVKSAGAAPIGGSFAYAVERRDRTIYFAALRNGDKENFFGAVIARDAVDQSLTVQRLDTESSAEATLEVALQGVTIVAHSVKVELNGSNVGAIPFKNQLGGIGRFAVASSLLKEGQNVVRLTSQGGADDVSLVDYIGLTYPHRYTADSDRLRFTVPGKQQITIDGFSSSAIRMLDVTNPNAVQELIGTVKPQKGDYAVALNLQSSGQRTLLAIAGEMAKPVSLAANLPSSLRQPANGADLVILTRRDFFAALKPLRSLRQKQGYSVALVDIDDVYDEFSYGQKTPQAVKDFFAYASASWKKAPRFVMLAGDASLDPKNYLGFGDADFVPTRLVDTAFMQTASDDWLVDFNGDGLPDMAIGRLPVRSADEALRLATKIAGYDGQRSAGTLLLVTDHNDTYDFESASDLLRGLIPPNIRIETVDRAHMDDGTAKTMLIEAINRGQVIVNYAGHGSANQWRGNILTSADAAGLTNDGQLSMFVMMTCLNGYFQDAALDSLGESLLKADGGAVAVWGSSGMTTPDIQSVLNQQAYRLIFNGTPLTIGEATARAKAAVGNGDVRRTWILLGDPTTRLSR